MKSPNCILKRLTRTLGSAGTSSVRSTIAIALLLVVGMIIAVTACSGEDLTPRVSKLENQVAQVQGSLAKTQDSMSNLSKAESDANDQVAKLQAQLAQAQSSLSRINDSLSKLQAANDQGMANANNASAQIQSSLDRLNKVQVMSTMSMIEKFHDINVGLLQASDIDPELLGTVHNARLIVGATPWPASLQTKVDAFSAALKDLEAALQANNLGAAKTASTRAHATMHDLTDTGWASLGGMAPAMGAMPMPSMTPGATPMPTVTPKPGM